MYSILYSNHVCDPEQMQKNPTNIGRKRGVTK